MMTKPPRSPRSPRPLRIERRVLALFVVRASSPVWILLLRKLQKCLATCICNWKYFLKLVVLHEACHPTLSCSAALTWRHGG